MGFITSASTVYATAYLTEVGRKYLFNHESTPRFVPANSLTGGTDTTLIDLFKIDFFSFGDSDVNYGLPDLLESGEIPDISGESDGTIKGTKGRDLRFLINPGDADGLMLSDDQDVQYSISIGTQTFV